jgi:bifunctional enzyme CysN/CysC
MTAALRLVDSAPVPASEPARRSLLRFITCGSVDDGKSTLIGRILYETGAVFEDQLDALRADSARFGTNGRELDYALLVDGLSAEREQGITIDVAYRYFATATRNFIVADTPGHEQYTRNMATGASTADAAVLLVDARRGLLPQTRRHASIVARMGVRHVVVAVNKMDLVDFSEATFRAIERAFGPAVAGLGFASVACVPVAARDGDNLVVASKRTPWHRGPPLLSLLERIDVAPRAAAQAAFAMPVQWVSRPDADFRGFCGTIASGAAAPGDAVIALPSGRASRIARIVTAGGDLTAAQAGRAVVITLADEIDLSRGDVLVAAGARGGPRLASEIEAGVIVTGARTIAAGESFIIKLGTATAQAHVVAVEHALDVETLTRKPAQALTLNDIGRVRLRFDRPQVVDDYAASKALGGFILIDRATNETSAFGFVEPTAGAQERPSPDDLATRLLGPAGSTQRQTRLRRISWRLSSALAMLLIVGAFAGFGWGAFAALADAALRPALGALHAKIWTEAARRRDAGLSMDGGGI